MKIHTKLLLSLIAYTISALGVAMAVTAAIGVSPYNAMNLTVADSTGITIGTVTIFFNTAMLIIFIILTNMKEHVKYLFQIVSVLFFGIMVNVFIYGVLSHITELTYLQRIIMLAAGTSLGGLAIGYNLRLNMITFPLESVCVELSHKTGIAFPIFRYGLDILFLSTSLGLSIASGLPVNIREGTAISMILFTFFVNVGRNRFAVHSHICTIES